MDVPTTPDVQGWTRHEELKNATPEQAALSVDAAISAFRRFTGVDFASVPARPWSRGWRRVRRGLSEMLWIQDSPEYIETAADFDLIQSFNAGPYSENRRSPDDARKARMLVAWPWLSDLLWGLMTPESYEEWDAFFSDDGGTAPAWGVQEVDWGGYGFDRAYYGRHPYHGA